MLLWVVRTLMKQPLKDPCALSAIALTLKIGEMCRRLRGLAVQRFDTFRYLLCA